MIILYKKQNVLSFDKYRIQPGSNDLPNLSRDQFLEIMKKHPKIATLVENGDIVIDEEGLEFVEDGNSAQALNKMKEKQAINLVKQTGNPDLLNLWLENTTSHNVKTVIKKQLEAFEKAGEKKAE